MTQVFIHPGVEDYFLERDFQHAAQDAAACNNIVSDYANEKLILLRNLKFDVDWNFLRSVSFYQKWKWKKLALSSFESIPPDKRQEIPEIREFVQDVFSGDWGQFGYFIDQAKIVNNRIRLALETIFIGYQFERRDIIWRFTETRVENLHFDVDRNCDDLELIRLYVNLDDIPRMWYTAGTFTSTGTEWYEKLNLRRFQGQSNDKLLKEISTRVYGDWYSRGRDTVPRHLALFEPGDVWLTDGRTVSHQVMYGRRVVSALFIARSGSVPDPAKTFAQKVADLHRQNGEGRALAEARSTPLPQKKTTPRAPLDLTKSWEELPERERKDTLVRL